MTPEACDGEDKGLSLDDGDRDRRDLGLVEGCLRCLLEMDGSIAGAIAPLQLIRIN